MTITITIKQRIAVVTINRPDARGAINPQMAQKLFDAFVEIDSNKAVDVAVLTGTQNHFCAGFDLKAAASGDAHNWLKQVDISENWSDPHADPIAGPMGPTRLMLNKPVIAAIEGYSVAGGLELATWCDMRIASKSAIFGVFCRRWGVPLIDGGTVRLPAILGQGRANDLILSGRAVSADEAMNIGLVNQVVEEGQALSAAMELAQSLLVFPQQCMRADHMSARMAPDQLALALKREWLSAKLFATEGISGAKRFADGYGRAGNFDAL